MSKNMSKVERIREDVKYIVEQHPEGVTADEVCKGIGIYDKGQILRATRYLYNTKQIEKIENDGCVQVYKPANNPKIYNGLDSADLYFKYERGSIKLCNGEIRRDDRKEIEHILVKAYEIRDKTYKDTSFKIRMYNEEETRVATLIYSPNGDKGVMYDMGSLIPKTDEELLNFVRGGEVL